MKICFLVPDGVGIRNYLYSTILKELKEAGHEVIVWHALRDNALSEVEALHDIKLHSERLPDYKESIQEKFLRETIAYARLKYNSTLSDNHTIMTNWAPSVRNVKLKMFYKAVELNGLIFSSYNSILKMEEKYQKSIEQSLYLKSFSDFLTIHRPDIVFNTHQRSVSAIPAITAAHQLDIKTVSAIYSWDNLPKARLVSRTDSYLVWSKYMKEEMKSFYPEISQENIFITGTPQFYFYKDTSLYWTKEVFCKKYNLNPTQKIICFSGDDMRTSPYDPQYLEDLANAMMQLDEEKRPQILFRRCPADFSDRYDTVINKYKEIIKISDPLWNRDIEENSWNLFYPAFDDVELLVNVALHCDGVYNVGSTMAHDFAIFDKPAIYINYDQTNAKGWSVETIYKFQHFRSMNGLNAVTWVNSKDEIREVLDRVLEAPKTCSSDRKKWLGIITGHETDVPKNIVNFLTEA